MPTGKEDGEREVGILGIQDKDHEQQMVEPPAGRVAIDQRHEGTEVEMKGLRKKQEE